jgi:hypothetical protein
MFVDAVCMGKTRNFYVRLMLKVHTYTKYAVSTSFVALSQCRGYGLYTAPIAACSGNSSLGSPSMKCNAEMSFVKIQMHKYKHLMVVSKYILEIEMEGSKYSYMQRTGAKRTLLFIVNSLCPYPVKLNIHT